MIKIGKNLDGITLYLTDEEFMQLVNGEKSPYGSNQQKAKMRKLINKYKKNNEPATR